MVKRLLPVLAFVLAAAVSAPAAETLGAQLPNPLKNVKPGQWARYRVNTLFGVAEQKQTVVSVEGDGDDRVITIKTEMSLDDEVVDEREEATTYRKLLDEQAAALEEVENAVAAPCETTLAGTTVSAVSVTYAQDGQKYTLFLSENIPLAGVIRLEAEDAEEPVVEIIDFGD